MKRTFAVLLSALVLTASVGTTATKRIIKPAKTVYCTFTPDEEMIPAHWDCFDDGQ